jgi:REG-2-like HAD superfamily hydrolase
MKVELVTLDAAGTLIDVRWRPSEFALKCARSAGLNLDEPTASAAYESLYTKGWPKYRDLNLSRDAALCDSYWRDLTAEWLGGLGYGDDAAALFIETFMDLLFGPEQTEFALFADAIPVLQRLRQLGLRIAILSNWDYSLHRIAKNLGLSTLVDAVFASLEFGPEKPDPALFKMVLQHMGVPAERTLHVGDDPLDDLQGARSVGMMAALLDRSRTKREGCIIPDLFCVEDLL